MNEETTTNMPKIAERLWLLFLSEKDRDCICGDLAEAYETSILPKYGLTRARLWYWKQVLLSICFLFWRGRIEPKLPSIFFGLAVGTIFFLFSWGGNRTPGLVSYFPDGLTALVLLGLTFTAVWICARRLQGRTFSDIWGVARWISGAAGIVSGIAWIILCYARFSYPLPFLLVLLLLLTALLTATLVGVIASVLVKFALHRHNSKSAV